MKKAELIAAAENRYFLDIDGGSPWMRGLRPGPGYAAGVEARVGGKPSRDFFLQALDSMGLEPSEALMVGDDIESDIAGAQRAGLRTALVHTGKFCHEDLERTIRPDWVLESVAEREGIL